MLQEGDKVPASLSGILVDSASDPEKGGKKVKLSSFWKEGPLVFYFYPKDMTPGCTTEAKDFQEALEEISRLGASVVGCSRDPVKSHCKFISKHSLEFPLISDESGEITEAFGAWGEKKLYGKTFMGIFRSTFVIEKGKVIKAWPKVKVKVHVEEIIEYLRGRQ